MPQTTIPVVSQAVRNNAWSCAWLVTMHSTPCQRSPPDCRTRSHQLPKSSRAAAACCSSQQGLVWAESAVCPGDSRAPASGQRAAQRQLHDPGLWAQRLLKLPGRSSVRREQQGRAGRCHGHHQCRQVRPSAGRTVLGFLAMASAQLPACRDAAAAASASMAHPERILLLQQSGPSTCPAHFLTCLPAQLAADRAAQRRVRDQQHWAHCGRRGLLQPAKLPHLRGRQPGRPVLPERWQRSSGGGQPWTAVASRWQVLRPQLARP